MLTLPNFFLVSNTLVHAQKQSFEEVFVTTNFPNQFLPNWYGNEVRSTNSRIFQAKGLGLSQTNALGVQPISSFDGEIIIRLNPAKFLSPSIQFWAKSIKNGSGDRAASVYTSWSDKLDSEYSSLEIVGSEVEFKNEDQQFRLFQLLIPESLEGSDELYLKFEIKYGLGSGTCARWILDDFEFGDFEEDSVLPRIVDVRGFEENEIQIQFSEKVDPVFSIIQLNYKLNGVEPESVVLNLDSIATLSFSEPLNHGGILSLAVSQIPDLAGNFLKDTLVSFDFFDPTFIPLKTLVINEIMPAPKADLDLPNVEYVELLNLADYPIRTNGLTWSNSRSKVLLSDMWIDPQEYLLLVPRSQTDQMEGFGKIIPLDSWPTLLNGGDQLRLQDQNGIDIDFLTYSSASWNNSEFVNSGYSLEVTNPFLACDQSGFLKVSVDPLRGTPGRENSVFNLSPDETRPFVTELSFLDSTTVFIQFSEPIQFNFEKRNIVFEPSLEIDTLFRGTSSSLIIRLEKFAEESIEHRVLIKEIFDCYGNELEFKEHKLILPSLSKKGDVIINELLFNPKTGRPKFVELFNHSTNYIDVGKMSLANFDDNGNPDQEREIKKEGYILPPISFLAITTDTLKLKQDFPKSDSRNFLQMQSLPSYPISGGSVVLLNQDKGVLEGVSYDEEMHHPLLRDPKGVSLERISTESPADLKINWHSSSGLEDYGTPGRKNSQVFNGEFDTEIIHINPEVFDPEGSNGNTFTTVSYKLNQSGWIGTFEIYDIDGRLVEVLDRNSVLGSSGIYTWSGTDDLGGKVRPGYYILLVELFDLQGKVKILKKTLVIASRF